MWCFPLLQIETEDDSNDEFLPNGPQMNNNSNNETENDSNAETDDESDDEPDPDKPKHTIMHPLKWSAKRTNQIICDVHNHYLKYYNSCISAHITNASVGRWEASIECDVPDFFFNLIWNDQNWMNDDGESVILIKLGKGGRTTKRDNGFLPIGYVWDKINRGRPMIGITKQNYAHNAHTFNLYKSSSTYKTTLSMQFEKKHVDCEAWTTMKAAKTAAI